MNNLKNKYRTYVLSNEGDISICYQEESLISTTICFREFYEGSEDNIYEIIAGYYYPGFGFKPATIKIGEIQFRNYKLFKANGYSKANVYLPSCKGIDFSSRILETQPIKSIKSFSSLMKFINSYYKIYNHLESIDFKKLETFNFENWEDKDSLLLFLSEFYKISTSFSRRKQFKAGDDDTTYFKFHISLPENLYIREVLAPDSIYTGVIIKTYHSERHYGGSADEPSNELKEKTKKETLEYLKIDSYLRFDKDKYLCSLLRMEPESCIYLLVNSSGNYFTLFQGDKKHNKLKIFLNENPQVKVNIEKSVCCILPSTFNMKSFIYHIEKCFESFKINYKSSFDIVSYKAMKYQICELSKFIPGKYINYEFPISELPLKFIPSINSNN